MRKGESRYCCSSSVLLYSTFFTAIFIFYVGGSDTALRFCCRSTSDFKQHFDTEWEVCTCGGSRWGSHADHLTWFVNNDIRIAEHWRRALLAVDRGGGGGCARKRGVAWGGDRRACREKVVRLLDDFFIYLWIFTRVSKFCKLAWTLTTDVTLLCWQFHYRWFQKKKNNNIQFANLEKLNYRMSNLLLSCHKGIL